MNIVYAGNYKVFDGLLISVLSVISHTKSKVDIYVLSLDLSYLNDEYKSISKADIDLLTKQVKQVNPQSSVTLIDVRQQFDKHLKHSKNLVNRYTPYALLRLLIDKLDMMPDKVIYLDVDTIVNRDLSELANIDISNYELAATRDRYGRFFLGPNYCNSGVLLLNVKMIRKTGLFTKVIALLAQKEVFLSDQTGINRMAKKIKILPRRFNEQKRVRNDTVVRHFSMQFRIFPRFHFVNIKPWDVDKVRTVYKCHHFDDLLDEYLQIIKFRSK